MSDEKSLSDALDPSKREVNPVDAVVNQLLYSESKTCKWAQTTIALKEQKEKAKD
ncbi:hypothetical protein L6270_00735 [Candidatus Parcubacteria bacterium]|nr:hypothetical protein [Patescibacteria group bacterium]MBU4309675.1 hypothetical protein [Patescibacteria group bacterium]MBU4432001.1 hypothetical protein [Patescibacteria group bacterium]MBU4577937.1 hypothetical protein [Patescibacteria group bacterium]MCG2696554.1 hypothetical protein [Candidatus Parcubacteria bacterium]